MFVCAHMHACVCVCTWCNFPGSFTLYYLATNIEFWHFRFFHVNLLPTYVSDTGCWHLGKHMCRELVFGRGVGPESVRFRTTNMNKEQTCCRWNCRSKSLNLALYLHGASETPQGRAFQTILGVSCFRYSGSCYIYNSHNKHQCPTFSFSGMTGYSVVQLSTGSYVGTSVHGGFEEAVHPPQLPLKQAGLSWNLPPSTSILVSSFQSSCPALSLPSYLQSYLVFLCSP